jgi:hypothetical protein
VELLLFLVKPRQAKNGWISHGQLVLPRFVSLRPSGPSLDGFFVFFPAAAIRE